MNTKTLLLPVCLLATCLLLPTSSVAQTGHDAAAHDGFDPIVLAGLAAMLLSAKLLAEIFERLKQPAVLGELIAGIVLGNLFLLGFNGAEPLRTSTVISTIAEIGVIILLFEVGLESDLKEMMEVGWSSLLVAVLGVVVPFVLGWATSAYFLPNQSRLAHIFIGAILCATSVGITARVFKDLGKLATREARIILGAAVIDDVLGLIILAVVAGAIRVAGTGGTLSITHVAVIATTAIGFLVAAILLGQFAVPRMLRGVARFESRGVLLTTAVSFCFLLSWAASKVGLAPIVGAFAAGLVLDEVHYREARTTKGRDLNELLQPVSTILVPIFFVVMGMRVDLRIFARLDILGFALVLTAAAVVGKQICSLGVIERGINRLAIGLGMIPRGEVGLIFAGIGASLMLPSVTGGQAPVVGPAMFGAVIIMVVITTLVTPPLLKWSLSREPRNGKDEDAQVHR